MCAKGVSATTSEPDVVIQPELTGSTFLAMQMERRFFPLFFWNILYPDAVSVAANFAKKKQGPQIMLHATIL